MSREEVRKKVAEILKVFGEYTNPEPYYINGTEPPYIGHTNYGLELRKMWRTDEYLVFYEGATVFDDTTHVYRSGEWEEVLDEYCKKIPTILRNRELSKERTAKCDKIYSHLKIYLKGFESYYCDSEKEFLGNSITLTRTSGLAPFSTTYRAIDVKLFVGNNEVFCRRKEEENRGNDYNDDVISYPTYIPGEWEKLIEEKYKKEKEQLKVKQISNLDMLKRL